MKTTPFSLKACYVQAWQAFSKWWIPLCLLSGVLIIFQLGPKQLVKAEMKAVSGTLTEIMLAFEKNDVNQLEELAYELNEASMAYAMKLTKVMLYAAPIVTLFSMLLLCTSMMAVKNKRTRYVPTTILFTAFINFFLAFGKVLLIFIFFPLGFYIYVKLFFVSLLMLEEQKKPGRAIRESWHLSNNHFWSLLGMVFLNGILQFALAPTIIGLIPASGFATTARASAYALLRRDAMLSESITAK
jgi:hypothetical protein